MELPIELRQEVQERLYSGVIRLHPYLSMFQGLALRRVCGLANKSMYVRGDLVIDSGAELPGLVFLFTGTLRAVDVIRHDEAEEHYSEQRPSLISNNQALDNAEKEKL